MFTNKQGFCKQTKTSYVFSAPEALFIIPEKTFLVKIIEEHSKLSFETNYIDLRWFWGVLGERKRIKNGPKLDKNFTKTVTWSFSDTFWTYFWWILLRNNTSFHLRLITLICDHFDEFYKQKTDQKRAKKLSKSPKIGHF